MNTYKINNFFIKYKTLILFLIILSIWSAFFTTFKFFLWWDLKDGINPSLQTLSWYLSLGSSVSFLVWWALAYTFLKKYFLFFISLFAIFFIWLGFFIWMDNNIILWIIVTFVWVFYWLWTVIKNIIISIEIKKTWLQDTMINAIASIVFIVAIIFWSIFWSILYENVGHNWLYVIIILLSISAVVALFLDYDKITLKSLLNNGFKSYYFDRKRKITDSLKEYIPDMKYISKKYLTIILISSFLWAISTIVSQKWVEQSVENFGKLPSEAAYVLLYSAVGVIIWNMATMKMEKSRWKFFLIFNIIFWLLIIAFPFLSLSFTWLSIMAFLIWIFFWWASNLIDAYFFRKIGEENKKEYGSATYGFILSLTIFFMMFFSTYLDNLLWFRNLMFILWFIILGTNIFIYKSKDSY